MLELAVFYSPPPHDSLAVRSVLALTDNTCQLIHIYEKNPGLYLWLIVLTVAGTKYYQSQLFCRWLECV